MPYQQGGNISFGGAPFIGQEEEQNPYQLSPYLAGAPPQTGQIPGISDYFSSGTPPINGRPPVEEMPPQGDEMSPPPQDPLMSELDRAKDWRGGAAIGLGAALGGIFGGTGAASASGAVAQSGQQHMLEALQQSRQLQAKDRENRFRLSEEKIQGAEKMMSELHGVDMAGMPDHVKQEMTRLTQLYNQKLQGGLTEKEATEVLAMGARMQQLMQEAKSTEEYAQTRGAMAGKAQFEQGREALGGEYPEGMAGWSASQIAANRNAETSADARVQAARERAQSIATNTELQLRRLGVQIDNANLRHATAMVESYMLNDRRPTAEGAMQVFNDALQQAQGTRETDSGLPGRASDGTDFVTKKTETAYAGSPKGGNGRWVTPPEGGPARWVPNKK